MADINHENLNLRDVVNRYHCKIAQHLAVTSLVPRPCSSRFWALAVQKSERGLANIVFVCSRREPGNEARSLPCTDHNLYCYQHLHMERRVVAIGTTGHVYC